MTWTRFDTLDACPRCGEGRDRRETLTGFGGWWRLVCDACGYVFDSGRGERPNPVELKE